MAGEERKNDENQHLADAEMRIRSIRACAPAASGGGGAQPGNEANMDAHIHKKKLRPTKKEAWYNYNLFGHKMYKSTKLLLN